MAAKPKKQRKKRQRDTALDTPKAPVAADPGIETDPVVVCVDSAADPGEGGVGGMPVSAGGDPLEQATEILETKGARFDEAKLAEALGLNVATLIEQRALLNIGEDLVIVDGVVLLTESGIGIVLTALGLAEKTAAGLQASLDAQLGTVLARARFDATAGEPEGKAAVVCGFPINPYLVRIRWPEEKVAGTNRYARVTTASRERMRHGQVITVYPPTKGNRWETKKLRRK